MDVYEIVPNFNPGNAVGVAMVAANSFEQAVYEYQLHGNKAEETARGDVTFCRELRKPISGLCCDGSVPHIIADFIYLDV